MGVIKMSETHLYLVRHGETDWNKKLRFQGQTDIVLNETGIQQAIKVKDFLKDKKLDYIFSSDLSRAVQTADIIADNHNLKLIKYQGLREMNFGEWEGMTYTEIKENYPELVNKWFEDPSSVNPPGGESLQDFQDRVSDDFNEIINKHRDKKLLVVAHGGVIRTWLARVLKMPLEHYWSLEVDNTGISLLKYYGDSPVLNYLNYKIDSF